MEEEVGLTPRQKAFLEAHPEAEYDAAAAGRNVSGVSGTLSLLAIILIVLGPILSIALTAYDHSEAARMYPEVTSSEIWTKIRFLEWIGVVIYCTISIYAGIILSKRLQKSTVYIVILCIWLSAPGLQIVELFFVHSMLPDGVNASITGGSLGRPTVFAVFWTIYLLVSKRVKNTYRPVPN